MQLKDHCNSNCFNSDFQSAYKEGFSCEALLFKLVNDFLWSMENQEVSTLVMIDLSAAFDTVDHDIFIKLMENIFGLTGTPLKWIEEYLRPRHFKVCITETYLTNRDLHFSVPQGSINGPALFNFYSSTIINSIDSDINVYAFADDHALCKSFNPNNKAQQHQIKTKLEWNMKSINDWMNANCLKMNPSKTEIINFGSRQQLKKCELNHLTVCENRVESSHIVRYLGTWLDEQLNFKHHAMIKCKTAMWNLKRI